MNVSPRKFTMNDGAAHLVDKQGRGQHHSNTHGDQKIDAHGDNRHNQIDGQIDPNSLVLK